MSTKYKFADNDKLYFVSFAVTNWIDLPTGLFIREAYKEEILNSIRFCQENKGLELYGWCVMTSHVHLIIGTTGNPLQNIMRDLKRHTSETLHKCIKANNSESRKEWMLWIACPDSEAFSGMERAAKKNKNAAKFQSDSYWIWQPESHPIQLNSNKMAHQKLDYIHYNPVEAGFVEKPEDWKYSSAIDYFGGKGLLEILMLDSLTL